MGHGEAPPSAVNGVVVGQLRVPNVVALCVERLDRRSVLARNVIRAPVAVRLVTP